MIYLRDYLRNSLNNNKFPNVAITCTNFEISENYGEVPSVQTKKVY